MEASIIPDLSPQLGRQTLAVLNGFEPELSGIRALMRPPLVTIVNDDPAQCFLFDLMIKRTRPYNLHFIYNGDQVIEFCHNARPDVIVSDVHHPGMNGFDLCIQIRSDPIFDNTPFLFLTAVRPPEFLNLHELRANYMLLPCMQADLIGYIDHALWKSRPEYMQQARFS